MTIVRSLKQLLAAMGGTPETTDNQTIMEVLADIYMYKANTTGVKFDTIMEAIDNIATVTEEGGGGDGWAAHTLIDDSSVEFESDPENPGNFKHAYANTPLGKGDFITVTISGDIQVSGQFVVSIYGDLNPSLDPIPITGGTIQIFMGIDDSDPASSVALFISYDTENPPTEAPSVSLKVERIGDSSGEQPWVESGGGDGNMS